MRFLSWLTLPILASIASIGFATEIDPFIGNYAGSAGIEEEGESQPRDMSVNISATDDGFELTWQTVVHKSDGRLVAKEYTIDFVPSPREGIYSSAMRSNVFGKPVPLNPLEGDPYVWARLEGDSFVVYTLLIDEAGGYDIQEYRRKLVEGGLELKFHRIRNGEILKTINAFLEKQ